MYVIFKQNNRVCKCIDLLFQVLVFSSHITTIYTQRMIMGRKERKICDKMSDVKTRDKDKKKMHVKLL